MPSYVVITDNTGAALGEGPIYRATRWTAASRLDRAARCSFEVPAADPRAHDLLQNKRQAHYYAVLDDGPQEVGTLIIDQIETVVEGRAEPMLRVSGDNLLAELATRSVHGLELYDVETVTATAVSHVWRYGDGSTYYSDLMDAAYDGDGGTVYQIDIGLKDWNYLYVAGATPLSATTLTLTGTSTAASGDIGAQYYNGDGWYDLVITSDGTHDGTRTLGQSGKIAWERPVDQVMTTHDGVEAYWVRLHPTVSTTDGLYIAEVDVDQDCETLTGLADIMAYAPAGWTVSTSNGGYATTKNGAYMQFAGETVLEALTMLAEHTGEHFRLGVGKSIDWLQDDPQENPTDSGVYAVGMAGAADSGNLDACYITELEEMRDSYQQISRIYAKGAGVGNAQVTLAGCTVTPEAGYSIDYDEIQGLRYYYLAHDATEASLGRVEAVRTWPEAGQMEADSAHAELAANALYQVAYEYLKRHITPQYAYTLRVAHLEREVWPGETVRVTYRRHRDGERYIDIDGAMVVLGVEMVEDGAGVRTAALEIASTDAWPLEGGEFLVRELRNARRRHAGNGGVGVIGGGGSVETLKDMALNSVIVLDSGQPYPLVYSPSDAGWTAAAAVAGAGDVIWLPAAGFSADITIPAGVTVRGRGPATVIAGTVTGASGATLQGVYVRVVGDSPDPLYGVKGAGDKFRVLDCFVYVENATGPARAVACVSGGETRCQNVRVAALGGSEGYGFYQDAGDLYVDHCVARAKDCTTAPLRRRG